MLLLLKDRSTTLHHYHKQECNTNKNEEADAESSYISLTVWTKSLVLSCKGFTVIGSDGSLVYRVDSYSARPHRIILMDASGNPIFTILRRKKLRIVDSCWSIYEGEVGRPNITSSKKPTFCVRKNLSIMKTRPSVLAYVHGIGSMSGKGFKYTIEGSYKHRSCKIMDESRRVCSEIKKKKALKGGDACFGVEVFDLIVQQGFDSRFAMAIVLLLDQMFS